MAQINTTVGDLKGNTKKILDNIEQARGLGVDLVTFPELLLPMVPDLTRLAADPGLQEGIAKTLKTVASRCPGKVGEILGRSLNECSAAPGEENW